MLTLFSSQKYKTYEAVGAERKWLRDVAIISIHGARSKSNTSESFFVGLRWKMESRDGHRGTQWITADVYTCTRSTDKDTPCCAINQAPSYVTIPSIFPSISVYTQELLSPPATCHHASRRRNRLT